MNIIKVAIILMALSVMPKSIYAQTTTKQVSSEQSSSRFQTDTLTYTVYGMDCPGCEGGLEKQVNKIPSVKYSKANWVKQELIIVVKQDSVLNTDELEKRVKKANFTLSTSQKNKGNEE